MEQKKYLIIIDNFGKIQEVPLESFGKDRLILGSDPVQCDIVIRSNIISHVHGKLKFMGPRVLFADLNSTNGTIVETDGYQKSPVQTEHAGQIYRNSVYKRIRKGRMAKSTSAFRQAFHWTWGRK